MKLFIPACGDRLRLVEPWSFRLFAEYRNKKFAHSLGLLTEAESKGYYNIYEGEYGRSPLKSFPVTLEAGDTLEADRIYIRQYNKSRIQEDQDYDSITFKLLRLKGKKNPELKPVGRFWVKLTDALNVSFELDADSLYRDRVKTVQQVLET